MYACMGLHVCRLPLCMQAACVCACVHEVVTCPMSDLQSILLQMYEKAIKDLKAGLPVDFDELPVPPGKLVASKCLLTIDTSSKWLCVHVC